MKLPDFKQHNWLNALRTILWAELNHLYRPENKPIWDLKVNELLENKELRHLQINEISVWIENLLEYKQNNVLIYKEYQVERGFEWSSQFHFYNCATIKKWREEKNYNWKYVANRLADFRVNIESYWKSLATNIKVDLKVCKNCLKESNYYNYENVDYNKKIFIYNNFSTKEYFEAVD
jgi:hypothetical protein